MKVALVSGCSRGIGEAVARRFLDNGYFVCGMSRREPKTLCERERFLYFRGDLGVTQDRNGFVKSCIDRCGKIDVLVNVAGVAPSQRADLLDMSEESYDYVMDINTKGTKFFSTTPQL